MPKTLENPSDETENRFKYQFLTFLGRYKDWIKYFISTVFNTIFIHGFFYYISVINNNF